MSNNAYDTVIADLKAKRDSLNSMIMNLEALASGGNAISESQKTPTEMTNESTSDSTIVPAHSGSEFLGMSIADAAKVLLQRERRKMKVKGIAKALEAGGMEFTGESTTNTIGSVLNRRQNKVGDIVSPERGYWGLKEWYPGRTFGKKAKQQDADSNQTTEPEQPSSPAPVFQLRSSEQP